MKMKYLFGILILAGLVSCEKEITSTNYSADEIEITTRTTSSAIPLVEDLEAYIQQLEAEGQFSSSVSGKIQSKLGKAKTRLQQNKANKAISELNKLIAYIVKQVDKGKIPSDIGALLKDLIGEIIIEISVIDNDGDGYSVDQDCDDDNAAINPGNTTGQVVFDAISMETIISQDLSNTAINGNDDETNLLIPGTIILYKTNQGRFGKLMIKTYGYNLTVQFLTYDYDGSIIYSESDYFLNGTGSIDLDIGLQDPFDNKDIFWQQLTDIDRQFTPLDDVAIALFVCM